jgi:hypothetical protein
MKKVSRIARRALGLALVVAAFAGSAQALEFTPEIDANTLGSAVTLLSGGLMLFAGRRRSR